MDAARAAGFGHTRIILRHMLPNVMAPYLIMLTAFLGQAILAESSLSFLGLGVQPPTPSWGGMLNDGKAYITVAWWLTTFPGAAIMLTVRLLGAATVLGLAWLIVRMSRGTGDPRMTDGRMPPSLASETHASTVEFVSLEDLMAHAVDI